MNEETKKKINKRYEQELSRGERFWPDSIFKDLIVSLGIFIVLILLATFIGVAPEPKADPADTSYLPRPEWYFLFLFKFLALYGQIPVIGKIEWIATVLVPGLGIGLLTLLPLLDKSPYRHYSRRIFALTIMGTVILDIILLTVMGNLPAAPDAAELAASTTLQTIGGLWIPAASIGFPLWSLHLQARYVPGVDEAEFTASRNGSRFNCDGCDDRRHQCARIRLSKAGRRGSGSGNHVDRSDHCRSGPVFPPLRGMSW